MSLSINSPGFRLDVAAAVAGPPAPVCVGGAAGCAPKFVGGVDGGFGTFAGGLMRGIMGAGGLINGEPPLAVSVGSVVGAGSTTGGGCKVASGEGSGT